MISLPNEAKIQISIIWIYNRVLKLLIRPEIASRKTIKIIQIRTIWILPKMGVGGDGDRTRIDLPKFKGKRSLPFFQTLGSVTCVKSDSGFEKLNWKAA